VARASPLSTLITITPTAPTHAPLPFPRTASKRAPRARSLRAGRRRLLRRVEHRRLCELGVPLVEHHAAGVLHKVVLAERPHQRLHQLRGDAVGGAGDGLAVVGAAGLGGGGARGVGIRCRGRERGWWLQCWVEPTLPAAARNCPLLLMAAGPVAAAPTQSRAPPVHAPHDGLDGRGGLAQVVVGHLREQVVHHVGADVVGQPVEDAVLPVRVGLGVGAYIGLGVGQGGL